MRKTALDSVYSLAKQDDRVLFIGSDLSPGILEAMKKELRQIRGEPGAAQKLVTIVEDLLVEDLLKEST